MLLHNRRVARPFEFLVRFLDLPRSGTLDPTLLMALVLPLMVGAMVGDVAYGALLLAARCSSAGASDPVGGGARPRGRFRRRRRLGDRLRLPLRRGSGRPRPQAGHARALVLPRRRRRGRAAAALSLAVGAAHVVLGLAARALAVGALPRATELLERTAPARAVRRLRARRRAADRLPGCGALPAARRDRRRARAARVAARSTGPDHRPARPDRHARQRPLVPAPRRRRTRLRVPGDRRERAR